DGGDLQSAQAAAEGSDGIGPAGGNQAGAGEASGARSPDRRGGEKSDAGQAAAGSNCGPGGGVEAGDAGFAARLFSVRADAATARDAPLVARQGGAAGTESRTGLSGGARGQAAAISVAGSKHEPAPSDAGPLDCQPAASAYRPRHRQPRLALALRRGP